MKRSITNVITFQETETLKIRRALEILWKQNREFIKQVTQRKEELTNALSEVDLQIQDCVHYLELESCDAVELVLTAKKIQTLQQQRRKIKEELIMAETLVEKDGINLKELSETYKSTYTFRSNVMDDVYNRRHKENNNG